MKVIFLDIDGVLNSEASARRHRDYQTFGAENVSALNHILDVTDAAIVVSSTWRIGRDRMDMQEILDKQGVRGTVIDVTPRCHRCEVRGHEIRAWLDGWHGEPVESFVVLDDSDDMDGVQDRLVQTDPLVGLTARAADRAIAMLAGPEVNP